VAVAADAASVVVVVVVVAAIAAAASVVIAVVAVVVAAAVRDVAPSRAGNLFVNVHSVVSQFCNFRSATTLF
jgi:hypothetical protein